MLESILEYIFEEKFYREFGHEDESMNKENPQIFCERNKKKKSKYIKTKKIKQNLIHT